MPSLIQPRIGGGRFQWNAGGWFGAVVGGTAWMLVAAGLLIADRQWLAVVPIGCFAIMNSIAWILWCRRDRLDPFRSLMIIMVSLAVAVPITMASTVSGSPQSPTNMNWTSSAPACVVVVLLVPALIAWFYFLERQAKR